jgi:hypothetical protein
MVVRATLVAALAALLLTGFVHGDGPPILPSRKAIIVLPLLKRFSSKDTYSKIETILGKPDVDIGSGIYIYVFRLDDSTSVTVGTPDRISVFGIKRAGYGVSGTQVIFARKHP